MFVCRNHMWDYDSAKKNFSLGFIKHIITFQQVWLSLATEYIERLQVNWPKVVSFAFNDKCNPDDDALGAQIVKVRDDLELKKRT